jgi:hypothetical protein
MVIDIPAAIDPYQTADGNSDTANVTLTADFEDDELAGGYDPCPEATKPSVVTDHTAAQAAFPAESEVQFAGSARSVRIEGFTGTLRFGGEAHEVAPDDGLAISFRTLGGVRLDDSGLTVTGSASSVERYDEDDPCRTVEQLAPQNWRRVSLSLDSWTALVAGLVLGVLVAGPATRWARDSLFGSPTDS